MVEFLTKSALKHNCELQHFQDGYQAKKLMVGSSGTRKPLDSVLEAGLRHDRAGASGLRHGHTATTTVATPLPQLNGLVRACSSLGRC